MTIQFENYMTEATVTFKNGIQVINTTPHPITFMEPDGTIVTCPADPEIVINARCEEKVISPTLVKTVFLPTIEGEMTIAGLKEEYPNAMIIGNIITTNAYKEVVGMTPCPGFERVPHAEKRMRTDKFNVGKCF